MKIAINLSAALFGLAAVAAGGAAEAGELSDACAAANPNSARFCPCIESKVSDPGEYRLMLYCYRARASNWNGTGQPMQECSPTAELELRYFGQCNQPNWDK